MESGPRSPEVESSVGGGTDDTNLIFNDSSNRALLQILEASTEAIGLEALLLLYRKFVDESISRVSLENKLTRLVKRGFVVDNLKVYYLSDAGETAVEQFYEEIEKIRNLRSRLYSTPAQSSVRE